MNGNARIVIAHLQQNTGVLFTNEAVCLNQRNKRVHVIVADVQDTILQTVMRELMRKDINSMIKTESSGSLKLLFIMNIYSALRSSRRKHLIQRVRKYINDDGFAGILESIDVDNPESVRQGCRTLEIYMKLPYMRPRVMAWLKSY